ncbi:MAG: hypothetical protein QG561_34 [Patescibacteria group bacterium]|jgi:gas vesicle protein|nr:hypothetical protein [Patescibacteria group bacterium]
MRLLTLLAGYAAGLAVAMKYRKDNGTSKLNDVDATKTKLNSFIDEVVDIHKTAYADVKGFISENFDDIENFDDLQKKVSGMISEFSGNLESHITQLKNTGTIKKDEILKAAEEFYISHKANLETAKSKAASFTGVSEETINSWFVSARDELSAAYNKIQSKFSENTESKTSEEVPDVKPVRKKAPVKSPKV